ncbi:hypothetical protein OROMI_022156 [Orobanche minor]
MVLALNNRVVVVSIVNLQGICIIRYLVFVKREIYGYLFTGPHISNSILQRYDEASFSTTLNKDTTNANSEKETIGHIFKHEQLAAAPLCMMKNQVPALSSEHLFKNDVVGIVATLGKVEDDNLSSSDLLYISSAVPRSNTLRVYDSPGSAGSRTLSDPYCRLQRESCLLTSNGKAAIVLVLEETEKISDTNRAHYLGNENSCLLVKALLDDDKRCVKIEDRTIGAVLLIGQSCWFSQ